MPPSAPEPQLMDIREFLAVMRRRKWSIALMTLIVAGVAVGLVYWRDAVYTSTARVEVLRATTDPLEAPPNMDTEAARVTSEPVAELAASISGIDALANETTDVEVSIPVNTTYLDISCTQHSSGLAIVCAQGFADAYVTDREKAAQNSFDEARAFLSGQIRDADRRIRKEEAKDVPDQRRIELLTSQLEGASFRRLSLPAPSSQAARIADSAELPGAPSNKDFVLTGALALFAGLALGTGLAFLRDRLDQRIAGRASLEDTVDGSVLAVVPRVKGWRKQSEARLVTLSEPDGMAAEAYRTARTALLYRANRNEIRVIEITSPGEREGKTTTTANLAVSLAQTGRTVVAISCDLRKPRLHRFFGIDNSVGLSNLLAGDLDPGAILETEVKGLRVIPSGPVPAYPAELLESVAMDELIRWLRGKADFVLLDTAPALIAADALALAAKCDGAVIVADAQNTTQAALARVRHDLSTVGVPIVGAILNRLSHGQAKHYPDQYGAYYSSSYRYRTEEPSSPQMDGSPKEISRRNLEQALEPRSQVPPEPEPEVDPDIVNINPADEREPDSEMWRSWKPEAL